MIRKGRKPLTMLGNSFFYGMVFLLIALAGACTNRSKIPSDVMEQEKMEAVMWDMIQADRFSTQFLERDSTAKKNIRIENLMLYERVFQLHKISREEFIRSFNFYLSRPDLNKVIYDTMTARAERRRSELYKIDTTR